MRNTVKSIVAALALSAAYVSPASAIPIFALPLTALPASVNPLDYPAGDSVIAPGLTITGGFNSDLIYGSDQSYIDIPGAIILTFATPVTGFGFDFTANDSDLIVTAYDILGRQLEQNIFAIAGLATPENFPSGYAGIVGLSGIASASITSAIGSASVVIGTVSYAVDLDAAPLASVPETASWAMMIVGLGGIGTALRRRRTASARLVGSENREA